jgi:hypothetical protein
MAPSSRMKRATRQRLWLAGGVLALLAIAMWQMHRDEKNAPGFLLSLDPSTIARVDMQMGHGPPEHYVKREDHWWRVDGNALTRTDDMRLRELVGIAAAPVQSWQPASTFDLAKIGLAPPQASLSLDGQTLNFGSMAAISHLGYVQVGPRIALISLRYMPRSANSETIKAE